MERYMPLTGIDLIPASLLIDTKPHSTFCKRRLITGFGRLRRCWKTSPFVPS